MKAVILSIVILLGATAGVEAAGGCAGGVCGVVRAKIVKRHSAKRTPVRNLLRR